MISKIQFTIIIVVFIPAIVTSCAIPVTSDYFPREIESMDHGELCSISSIHNNDEAFEDMTIDGAKFSVGGPFDLERRIYLLAASEHHLSGYHTQNMNTGAQRVFAKKPPNKESSGESSVTTSLIHESIDFLSVEKDPTNAIEVLFHDDRIWYSVNFRCNEGTNTKLRDFILGADQFIRRSQRIRTSSDN